MIVEMFGIYYIAVVEKESIELVIHGLPKVSLNTWYSGNHWSKRLKTKKEYTTILQRLYGAKKVQGECNVEYEFGFKKNPLDCSNCVAMVKLIEDILFEKDDWKVVKSIKISSKKAEGDWVRIVVR